MNAETRSGAGVPIARRSFLRSLASLLPLPAVIPAVCNAQGGGKRLASGPADAERRPARFEPEYARGLEECLVAYDQVAPDHLFREVLEIVGCLPPAGTVHFLCSRAKEAEATRRLEEHGIRAHLLVCDCAQLWGDWARDIFHVGWRDGETVLLVPYTKTAVSRGQLTRGFEVLKTLWSSDRDVKLVPLSFEGGNLAYDRIDGDRVLFVGNSALLDSMALYRRWFGRELSPQEVVDLLLRSFQVDRVVPMGRMDGKAPRRQAELLFHIDLACTILREGVVAIQRFEVPSSTSDLSEDVEADLELAFRDAESRRRTEERLARKGIRVKLPETSKDRRKMVGDAIDRERERLREAEEELAGLRRTFRGLGYRIVDLHTDWRHVRRTQSYANVLVARDRVILPIFPRPEAGKARVVVLPEGRQIVEVLRHPEATDYAMRGPNRENYRVYRSLFDDVRVVKDSFFLAGGNIHCVVGAIA